MTKNERQTEALTRATTSQSERNDAIVVEEFAARGITATPRVDVFSYNAWRALGRQVKKRPEDVKSANPYGIVIDAAQCGKKLRIRRRRNGDRFQPLGMTGAKKLQDFFVDAHVPREERDNIPLVVSEHGIVWVVGQRPAEWAKVTKDTKRYLRILARS